MSERRVESDRSAEPPFERRPYDIRILRDAGFGDESGQTSRRCLSVRALRAAVRRRRVCPACGHELGAMGVRCSECGRVVEAWDELALRRRARWSVWVVAVGVLAVLVNAAACVSVYSVEVQGYSRGRLLAISAVFLVLTAASVLLALWPVWFREDLELVWRCRVRLCVLCGAELPLLATGFVVPMCFLDAFRGGGVPIGLPLYAWGSVCLGLVVALAAVSCAGGAARWFGVEFGLRERLLHWVCGVVLVVLALGFARGV